MNEILRSKLSKYEPVQNLDGESNSSGSIVRGLSHTSDRISALPSMPSFGSRAEHQSTNFSPVQRRLPQYGDSSTLGLMEREPFLSSSTSHLAGPASSHPDQRLDGRGDPMSSSAWADHTRSAQVDGVDGVDGAKGGWSPKGHVDGTIDGDQSAPQGPDGYGFPHLHPQDQHHQHYQHQPGHFLDEINLRSHGYPSTSGSRHAERNRPKIDGELGPPGK